MGMYWRFADDWHEVWVEDVPGACVVAASEQEALTDITSQLEACLEGFAGRLPQASDQHTAAQKAVDTLKEFQSEQPGRYPEPSAQRVVLVRCRVV